MENNATICCKANIEHRTKFKELYHVSLSTFLRMCLIKAIQSKDFFASVYFDDSVIKELIK